MPPNVTQGNQDSGYSVTEDKHLLIWSLLNEIGETVNYKVPLRKERKR